MKRDWEVEDRSRDLPGERMGQRWKELGPGKRVRQSGSPIHPFPWVWGMDG